FLPPDELQLATSAHAPRVWVESGGSDPSPLAVTTGLTNGELTEIDPGALAPGARVIVDVVRSERPRTSGPTPFGCARARHSSRPMRRARRRSSCAASRASTARARRP